MKKIELGSSNFTGIYKSDDNTTYIVQTAEVNPMSRTTLATIPMQTGPTTESTVNGLFIEDLLVMAQDRIDQYNQGDWVCEENNTAIDCIKGALAALKSRTDKRKASGKYGTSIA